MLRAVRLSPDQRSPGLRFVHDHQVARLQVASDVTLVAWQVDTRPEVGLLTFFVAASVSSTSSASHHPEGAVRGGEDSYGRKSMRPG